MNFHNDQVITMIKSCSDNVYLVGGAVRDMLMGKLSYDKDIIVPNALEFAKIFAEKYDRKIIELDTENNIYRIVLDDKENCIDITQPINGSLTDDLNRRDFTINAIALNLKNNEIIDIHNGCIDFHNKIIRAISKKNILDDPLRILRAYRFSATLGFNIDVTTHNIINECADYIKCAAQERINYELMKLFEGQFTANVLLEMDSFIERLYPIFTDVKKVPPNTHHHLNLYEHSVETVRQIQNIYQNASLEIQTHLDRKDFGGFSRLAHLKFAGFLHDIGKYSTWSIEGDRHRFIKHDDIGSKIAFNILRENKFSKKQIDYICSMVRNHIYPSQVVSSENITEKIYLRYIRKMQDDSIDNIILAMADRLSAIGPAISTEIVNKNIKGLEELLDYYLSVRDTLKPLPKFLSGDEIMQLKGLEPSPQLGQIIEALKQEQLDGNINSKEDAVCFILSYKF